MSAKHVGAPPGSLVYAPTLDGGAAGGAGPREPEPPTSGLAPTLPDTGESLALGPAELAMSESLPARIGRYAVLRCLGRGAMGVVYSAYDPELDRKVAIKVVRDTMRARAQARKRVLQEAQTLARLSHPHVVQVYEVGEDASSAGQHVFIAMEFIAGVSLRTWQAQHPLTDERSFDALLRQYLQAAAGLSAAHQSGLIHRDFKPENVLVGEDGRVRVVDFGLARALDGAESAESANSQSGSSFSGDSVRSSRERLTQVGTVMGTPGFMAPEQIAGQTTDERSDQWSFCAALYEALYGALPFGGENFDEISLNVLSGELPPTLPSPESGVAVPAVIEQALRRGLAREPEARFPSMAALITALEAGLLPDADSVESGRLKRRVGIVLPTIGLLLIGARHVTRQSEAADSLGSSVLIGWALLLSYLAGRLVVRKQLRRQPLFRRGVYFIGILCAYFAVGRTLGWYINVPLSKYLVVETLALSALILSELPLAGRYYWLSALTCWVSIVFQIKLPQYYEVIMNITYCFLLIGIGYLRIGRSHVRAAGPPPGQGPRGQAAGPSQASGSVHSTGQPRAASR